MKIGDGTTAWTGLAYVGGGGSPTGAAGGVLDGTYPNPGLAAGVAGAGLAETSDVLSVNVDGSTIEINTDALRVKAGGIGANELASSGVSAATYGDATHSPQIAIDADGRVTAASNIAITGAGALTASDGWVDDSAHTWTYASASTFTIAGVDLTSVFTPGTRLKFTQTTVKYGIVASSSFSTNTTVTIIVNTDYVLANAAISANYYSYVANPQGYPGWFNYTSGCAGFSALSTNDARFATNGRVCQLAVHFIGTSNATTFTFNLPVACVAAEQFNYFLTLSNDNSVTAVRRLAFATTTSGRFDAALNANNGWTASGVKSAVIDLAYEF